MRPTSSRRKLRPRPNPRAASDLAAEVMERIEALSRITDEPGRITRTFGSSAMRRANDLVAKWMRQAGMTTREDAIGNLIGHYPGARPRAKIFVVGSHLDTVPNAGKFDGPLGVLLGIACVEALHRSQQPLPFALEIIGFADEEGVRFQTAYLGSGVAGGNFDPKDLQRKDAAGVSLAQAIKRFGGNPRALSGARLRPDRVLGYLEAHIEQGRELEARKLPVGVVTGINGQSRLCVRFRGVARHAGTEPMKLRRDALAGAAEFVLAVERCGATATVGQLEIEGGASNVVPGCVNLTLDVRDAADGRRRKAVQSLRATAGAIAGRRRLELRWLSVQETATLNCDRALSRTLGECVTQQGLEALELPSGAGHDAVAMAGITPVAMLFIRCRDGISHHPAESVKGSDVRVALAVMNDFFRRLAIPK